jgi:hypothetical protein
MGGFFDEFFNTKSPGFDIGDLGGVAQLGLQTYNMFNQGQQADRANQAATEANAQTAAEDKRRWDLNYQLQLAKLNQGGGGGGGGGAGPDLKTPRAQLLSNAYTNAATLAQNGRQAEAEQLKNLTDQLTAILKR